MRTDFIQPIKSFVIFYINKHTQCKHSKDYVQWRIKNKKVHTFISKHTIHKRINLFW